MTPGPLYIVDIMKDIVTATNAKTFPLLGKNIVYEHGRSIQILNKLLALNGGVATRQKYPLFALFQDFPESMGGNAYYATVKFPKMIIGTLSNATDDNQARYDKNFKPILYPIYWEFLKQIPLNGNIVINDPGAIPHTKWDRPGTTRAVDDPKLANNFNDFLDTIEIENMVLTFKQINSCKILNT